MPPAPDGPRGDFRTAFLELVWLPATLRSTFCARTPSRNSCRCEIRHSSGTSGSLSSAEIQRTRLRFLQPGKLRHPPLVAELARFQILSTQQRVNILQPASLEAVPTAARKSWSGDGCKRVINVNGSVLGQSGVSPQYCHNSYVTIERARSPSNSDFVSRRLQGALNPSAHSARQTEGGALNLSSPSR